MSKSGRLDRIGMAMSIICILHCVAAPLVLFFLPAVTTAFLSEEAFVHRVLYGLILLVAVFSFIPGYRIHRKLKPLAFFGVGLAGLTFATF